MQDILGKSRINKAIEVAISAAETLKDEAPHLENPEKGYFALASLLQSIATLEGEITKRAIAAGQFDNEEKDQQEDEMMESNVIRMPTSALPKIIKD